MIPKHLDINISHFNRDNFPIIINQIQVTLDGSNFDVLVFMICNKLYCIYYVFIYIVHEIRLFQLFRANSACQNLAVVVRGTF